MYEAMRQRAPFSTRIAGMTATVVLGAAAGYVLLTGFGAAIVKAVQRPMTVISLAPPPVPDQKLPPPRDDLISTTTLSPVDPPSPPLPTFVIEDGTGGGGLTVIDPPPVHPPPPAHTAVRTAPKMKLGDPPPYPAVAIRGNMQGTSAITLCIDARGRVTSAALAGSSGHDVLDQAALKWVRDARFTPGTVDGSAQPVCGHPVEYVWNLETLRR
jgi:protein TonB